MAFDHRPDSRRPLGATGAPGDRAPRVGEGDRCDALRSPAIRRPALVDPNADSSMGIGRKTRNVALAAAHPPNLRAGSCRIEGGGRGRALELASSGAPWEGPDRAAGGVKRRKTSQTTAQEDCRS